MSAIAAKLKKLRYAIAKGASLPLTSDLIISMKHRITRSTIAPRNAPLGLLYTHVGKHRTLQRATEGNRTLTRSLGSCCATTTPQSRCPVFYAVSSVSASDKTSLLRA